MIPAYNGLVVCGGASTRMGEDKSLLQYYELPQRYHVAGMLQPFCKEVFLSLNKEQYHSYSGTLPAFADLPVYGDTGPAAALLTASALYPDAAFLVVGCDYPLLTKGELASFTQSIYNTAAPAAFYNPEADRYEPLLAFYPGQALQQLQVAFRQHAGYSLQQLLRDLHAAKYIPEDPQTILSIDTPERAAAVRQLIAGAKQ